MQVAIKSGDADRIVDAIAPPAMRRAAGIGLGLSEEQLPSFDAQLVSMTKTTLGQARYDEFIIDYDAIEYKTSSTGVSYANVPVSMTLGLFGQTFHNWGDYFALVKDDRWLVLSPSDANTCLLYTSPSPRDATLSRMPSSA